MVQINFAQKTVNVKIVYYGPGMSGKTTNLEIIHQRAPEGNRGDLTSISTDGDRTLFFDYMPLDLGTVAGMRTAFQLYTVPGQVYYNSTRKLVLQGVDGVIFIADSSASMINQNLESLRNLEENLNEYGKSLATLPHVIQFNKRDLPDAMSVEELSRVMNPHHAPTFEATANSGQGVFPTLKALAANVLRNIMSESGQKPAPFPAPAAPAPAHARPPAGGARPQARPAPGFPAGQTPHAPLPGAQPGYSPTGLPPGLAGGGFFPGAAQPQIPMQVGPPPRAGGGLQLAQPAMPQGGMQQTRSQPRPPLGVAQPAAPRPVAPPAARPQRAAAPAPAPARKAVAAKAPAPQPPAKRGKLTPILIVAGAGAGAVLAWMLMNVL